MNVLEAATWSPKIQISEWNTVKEGVFSGAHRNVFYPVFCISGDLYPAVRLYCSVGVISRICWYLCHAVSLSVARLSPCSALPLFFSPKATFDLAGCHPAKNCPEFSDLSPTRLTRDILRTTALHGCLWAHFHSYMFGMATVPIHFLHFREFMLRCCVSSRFCSTLPAVSVVLCPSFILPVPHITPDQATNYGCWHEPPCNLKSTLLCCFALSLCLQSCHSSPSIQLYPSPPPPLSSVISLYVDLLTH